MMVDGSVFVKPTAVAYKMRNARVRIIPNEIILEKDTITDHKDTSALSQEDCIIRTSPTSLTISIYRLRIS